MNPKDIDINKLAFNNFVFAEKDSGGTKVIDLFQRVFLNCNIPYNCNCEGEPCPEDTKGTKETKETERVDNSFRALAYLLQEQVKLVEDQGKRIEELEKKLEDSSK